MRRHVQERKNAQMLDWIDKADTTSKYLLSLVNDILDMSKIQAGKVELVEKPFMLEDMIDAVCSVQRSNIEANGVEFIVEKDITVPCIIGDETRIKQVLMNIVGNAAKFTPRGGTIKGISKPGKSPEWLSSYRYQL
ncbi:MAG: sensor histidine kinase [Enterocloster clostridioformis]